MAYVMIGTVAVAIRVANVLENKARAASQAIVGSEDRLHGIERALDTVKSDVALLNWMVGANFALTAAVLACLCVG